MVKLCPFVLAFNWAEHFSNLQTLKPFNWDIVREGGPDSESHCSLVGTRIQHESAVSVFSPLWVYFPIKTRKIGILTIYNVILHDGGKKDSECHTYHFTFDIVIWNQKLSHYVGFRFLLWKCEQKSLKTYVAFVTCMFLPKKTWTHLVESSAQIMVNLPLSLTLNNSM